MPQGINHTEYESVIILANIRRVPNAPSDTRHR
jgi:hypothetical protein